jgi:hypothetical protein
MIAGMKIATALFLLTAGLFVWQAADAFTVPPARNRNATAAHADAELIGGRDAIYTAAEIARAEATAATRPGKSLVDFLP